MESTKNPPESFFKPTFASGFISTASSTITSGLFSMNGGASTTVMSVSGNAYFASQGIWNSSGNVGIGTTTPWAKLSINANSGETNTMLFVIASSTPTATTTHFSINNQGQVMVGGATSSSPLGQFSVLPGTTTPVRAGAADLTGGAPSSVFVQGRYAYTVSYGSGANSFEIWDVSNPVLPKNLAIKDLLNQAISVVVQGRYAYITTYATTNGFEIWDVANPAAPVRVSASTLNNSGYGLYVRGRYAYILGNGTTNAFEIWDVSNPYSPTRTAQKTLTAAGGYSISVQGDYAYLANAGAANGFEIWNVANPAAPYRASQSTLNQTGGGLAVQGRYAYFADSGAAANAFEIWDISNPVSPSRVAQKSLNTTGGQISIQGRYAYIVDSGTTGAFEVWDISSSTAPAKISEKNLSSTGSWIYTQGRYAYMANFGAGSTDLEIWDLGGSYVSQLEAGGLETGTLSVRSTIQGMDASFWGALTVGQSLHVTGNASFVAASSTFNTTANIFNITTASSTNPIFSVLGNGKIGIGTSTPFWNLTIASSSGPQLALTDGTASSHAWTLRSISNTLYFATSTATATSSVAAFSIDGTTGAAAFGSSAGTGDADVTFAADANAWTVGYYSSDKSFRISSSTGNGSNTAFSISKSNLYVGIGSTTPSQMLTVNGNVNIAAGKCYMVNGVCIGYVVKLAAIYATSTPSGNSTTTVVFTGSQGSAPSYSANTLTLPSNTSYIVSEIWGAGGGGGGQNVAGGGGGGGGGYSRKLYTSLLSKYYYSIGTGGAGGGSVSTGSSGSVSVFGDGSATTTANGGGGGQIYTSNIGGTGGTASGGDINISGNAGDDASYTGVHLGGVGGTAAYSSGGGIGGLSSGNGGAGTAPGAGGGGAGGSGTSGGNGAAGGLVITLYATSSPNAAGNDYAELFPVSNPSIAAGDIVAVDKGLPVSMKLAAKGDQALAGIISTEPGQLLGDKDSVGMRPVALMGRVPAKVNMENGPIAIGDRVAVSSAAGVGMKAGPFDDSVGIALESSDHDGTIMVFVTLGRGIDINALAMTLLGDDASFFAASSTATSTISGTSASPIDFVAGMMNAFASRIYGVTALNGTTTATTTAADSAISGFIESLFGRMIAWLGDAANGIDKIFAKDMHAENGSFKKLCLEEVCVTKTELQAMLAASNVVAAPAGQPSGSAVAPIIAVNGNNPASVAVGTNYTDLGASITGPTDALNLGISAIVDGDATTTMDQISIDTTVPGTHTILYFATTPDGVQGSAVRTVVVFDPATTTPPPAPAPEPALEPAPAPAPADTASSTPETTTASSTDTITP